MERKIYFRENWLIFMGIWGETELILRVCGAKENTFRELRNFLSGIWGDQCIIFRDQGSTDPSGASLAHMSHLLKLSYCDHRMSIVHPLSLSIASRQSTMCFKQRLLLNHCSKLFKEFCSLQNPCGSERDKKSKLFLSKCKLDW